MAVTVDDIAVGSGQSQTRTRGTRPQFVNEGSDLPRKFGLTTVFGNPGSTEQTFLKDFPDDFTYVLALQGTSALVNLHTAAGTGNAIGSLVAAYKANTPVDPARRG